MVIKSIFQSLLFYINLNYILDDDSWTGKWFPNKPGDIPSPDQTQIDENNISEISSSKIEMGIINEFCDDGEKNLEIDFDAKNMTHSLYYICSDVRSKYKPNIQIEPIEKHQQIPLAYVADHKCMNETIKYLNRLPT